MTIPHPMRGHEEGAERASSSSGKFAFLWEENKGRGSRGPSVNSNSLDLMDRGDGEGIACEF